MNVNVSRLDKAFQSIGLTGLVRYEGKERHMKYSFWLSLIMPSEFGSVLKGVSGLSSVFPALGSWV